MFTKIARPDYTFLLGAMQALFPYVLWGMGGGIAEARFDVGYYPIAIWLIAYASFWVGTRFLKSEALVSSNFDLRPYSRRIIIASLVTTAALIAQVIWAARAYGTLPLLSYIAGDGMMDVTTANDLQDKASFGQFGFLIVSTYVANGVMLLLLILNGQQQKRRLFVFGALFISLLVGNLINGKRQGILISAVYVAVGLLIHAGSKKRALDCLYFLPRNRYLRLSFSAGMICVGLFLMGKMADIRTEGEGAGSGTDEIIRYLEFPILNLSSQCDQAGGFGPYAFSLTYPLQRLLPFKMIDSAFAEDIPFPARVEITSPSGMFEMIHWGWGLLGIIGYSMFLGILCTYAFRRAHSDIRFLLIYPSFAYALLTAHSYNHFLNLTFVPIPSLIFWLFTKRLLKRHCVPSETANSSSVIVQGSTLLFR